MIKKQDLIDAMNTYAQAMSTGNVKLIQYSLKELSDILILIPDEINTMHGTEYQNQPRD